MPRKPTKGETRGFKVHPSLLYDVICRQAGTLAKAALEGVMNSADAGATRCDIVLDEKALSVSDDGKGFTSRREVEDFFEVFGRPHGPEEKKTFGTFRMGRGQLFAFGRNEWVTGRFRMLVDVKGKGLDYELHESERGQPRPGCAVAVDLYAPLLPSEVAETERQLEHWCRYAPLAVTFNGRRVSRDPSAEKWDEVTEDACWRFTRGGPLAVYNLGIHVADLGNYRYGTGGVVVSKKQLKVNFARNDIQSDCPVFRRIAAKVNQQATARNLGSQSLDEAARTRLAHQARDGELPYQTFRKLKLLTAVTGRQHALEHVRVHRFTEAPEGCPRGDKVHRLGGTFVLSDETARRFRSADPASFVAWLAGYSGKPLTFVPFEEASRGLSGRYVVLDPKQCTPTERVWLRLCEDARLLTDRGLYRWRFAVGESDTADGWTDGKSFVAVSRAFLRKQKFDAGGVTALGLLLLHELCHDEADMGAHPHDQDFYERFHDGAVRQLPLFVERVLGSIPQVVKAEGRRATREQLKTSDKVVAAARAAATLQETPAR
jgi:hypothetical protein